MFYLQIYSIPKQKLGSAQLKSVPNAWQHYDANPKPFWTTVYEHPHFEQCRRNEIIVNAHRDEPTRIISTGIEPA